MKKTIICFLILFGLSSCKLDFVGDVYTSDLISIAEKGGSINLPMEIKFQVTSCGEDSLWPAGVTLTYLALDLSSERLFAPR